MERIKQIEYLLSKQETRYVLLEQDLFLFWLYYFTESLKSPSPDFHKEWCKAFQWNNHLLIIAFRESAKTFWAFVKFIHNIVYRKKRLQMFYCYDKRKSASRLFDIAIALQTNKKIIQDFWALFPWTVRNAEEASQKKSISEFITNNGIKCKAMSIGESPRWEVFLSKDWTFRPDAVFLDDIDVDKSVNNVQQIEKTYNWIKWELLWGISDKCQIIFLWNIIKNDWIVLRFEADYKDSKKWKVFRKAIVEDGKITWHQRYSQEDVDEKRRMLWEISFNQNMLLIPYSWWDSIIKRHQILYKKYDTWDKIIIWLDPAISEKALSDDFAIVVTAYIGKFKNIKSCYALKGTEKNPYNAVQFAKNLYILWKAKAINVEVVAFQKVLSALLKTEKLAVNEINPSRDKVTRLMEKQAEFEQGFISFDPEWEGIKDLIEELINFPNVIHDDRVDAMVYSLDDKTPEIFIGSF